MINNYLLLAVAIVAEVIATTALAKSENFTRLIPSLIAVFGYAAAFGFLSFPIKVMPAGVVYAIWSGLGIVLITGVSWIWYQQKLDIAALIGLGFIIAGVFIINIFSNSMRA